MLWTAPPLAGECHGGGTVLLLEICAAHESLRGTFLTKAYGTRSPQLAKADSHARSKGS
jgi:hypothetical protein